MLGILDHTQKDARNEKARQPLGRLSEQESHCLLAQQLGPERIQGIAAIAGGPPAAGPAWVAERLEAGMGREAARAVWLEAMRRPGLLVPSR